jgi:rhodanese-related sulfurtransferase
VTWVALAVAALALVVALSARMKAGTQGGQVEEAARDARRRIDALGEELGERHANLRRMVAELAGGTALTRQQVLDGMLWSEVGPDEGRALVEGGGVGVLDVRTASETAGGIIPGAVLIPVEELENRFRELSADGGRTLVCCAGGARSAYACEFLSSKGYTGLINLAGGMSSWSGPTQRP